MSACLASLFEEVHSVDISESHIELGRRLLDAKGISNITWHHLESIDQLKQLPGVDMIFSIIVLQHNPSPVSLYILRQLLKKLNPEGIAYFQTPTYLKNYRFSIDEHLAQSSGSQDMEMHPIPQSELFKVFQEEDVNLLEVRRDGWCKGMEAISETYLVQKTGRPAPRRRPRRLRYTASSSSTRGRGGRPTARGR